jgi:integrase
VGGEADAELRAETMADVPYTQRSQRPRWRLIAIFHRGWTQILAALLHHVSLPFGEGWPEPWPQMIPPPAANPPDDEGLAPHTMKNYLITLKSSLGWAVQQKLLPSVPTFPAIKVPKKKPQPIPAESFEELLGKAPDVFWRTYLLCGWWAGLRLSEAHKLQWDRSDEFPWIDFEGSRIVLPAVFAKSDTDQWVPLHPVLRQALAELPRGEGSAVFDFRSRSGKPLSRSSITHHVLAIAKKAGVKLSMHKLRKGFGCRAAKQLGKGNAPILRTLMRPSSMQITMDYYASVDDALQEAIGALT